MAVAAIAVLHPAAALVVDDLDDRHADVVEAMPRLAEILAESRSWTTCGGAMSRATGARLSLPPDIAGWMDAGIFSRWLLEGVPPCVESLAALRDLLPRSLVDRVRDTLARWQVPLADGPDRQPPAHRHSMRRGASTASITPWEAEP